MGLLDLHQTSSAYAKEMSFEEFKDIFQGKIQYKSQSKELQPELRKIYEAIAGKKKPTRRKASADK